MNRLKLHTLLFLLLGTLSWPLYAQQGSDAATNHQLGLQYYRNQEYQKAAEVFEQLYNSNRSNAYYSYYLNSLIQIEAYEKAESLVKNQIRFDKHELSYYVDLGNLYALLGNEAKAKASYESAISKLQPNQHQVIRLANAFMMKRLYSYAEACYFEGRKLMKGAYGFQMDLAQLYYYMRDYDKMIAQYLDLLRISDMYLNTVQARLQNAVYNDIDNSLTEKLKNALLDQVNKHPDVLVYSEMLVARHASPEVGEISGS